jgi:UDP-N-acetylmuramoyl-L-alanyl-D-glutamate--2,6-diaminopimelate ligase
MALTSFIRALIPNWFVNYFYHLPLSFAALLFYGYPARKLTVIGVTGTDGKTTTSTLIYEILRKSGKKVALLTTVGAKIGGKVLDTGLHVTTPDSWELQRLLKYIGDQGFKYLVLESTSHGLAQFRLTGCNFYTGVVTNVTHEHFDYHGNWENYLKAKGKLFEKSKISILNVDDKSYGYLEKISKNIVTYGLKKGDYTPQNFKFKSNLIGDYNISNCLAAIACAKSLDIDDDSIKEAILGFRGVEGRMETVYDKKFRVIVDFAHTPNALENALKTLRKITKSKLIAVFGCAGLRDHTKRPLMGLAACKLADKVILTAEDPRTEDINEIFKEILKGCHQKNKVILEPDREKAIEKAIAIAQNGDVIGNFGKGHEKSLCIGTVEYPWSDKGAVQRIIKRRQL